MVAGLTAFSHQTQRGNFVDQRNLFEKVEPSTSWIRGGFRNITCSNPPSSPSSARHTPPSFKAVLPLYSFLPSSASMRVVSKVIDLTIFTSSIVRPSTFAFAQAQRKVFATGFSTCSVSKNLLHHSMYVYILLFPSLGHLALSTGECWPTAVKES